MKLDFVVDSEIDIKNFLKGKDFSIRLINQLFCDRDRIKINDKMFDGNFLLKKGDRLEILLDEELSTIKESQKDIDIIFENEYFIVINKPKDLSTIPSVRHYEDNLAGRVKYYYKSNNIKAGIHVVNRLDYLTQGLVIFAKSQYIHSLFSKIEIIKKYKCTVNGILKDKSGIIDKKIDRESDNSIKRCVVDGGKVAITKYNVLKEENGNSKLDIELLTGRTHQIRVHFSSINHALIGDKLYGDGIGEFDLKAYYIKFIFPLDKNEYKFEI